MARSILSVMVLLIGARAQAQLEFRDVQAAYGQFGPERKSLTYFPADDILFRYLLVGVTTDAKGQVDIDIVMQVTNAGGRLLVDRKISGKAIAALGGCVPGYVHTTLGENVDPGTYHIRVKVKDNLSGNTAAFERAVTMKESTFAPVSQRFFLDADGKVPNTAGGIIGQSVYFRIGLIGFDRSKGRVESRMDIQILDDQGKETLGKSIETTYKNDNADEIKNVSVVNFNGSIALNRVGNFTLRFIFTDAVGNQKARFEVPLRVTEP